MKLRSRSCTAVMGRKGRQMLATSTEKMLPKFELAHIFTYLFMLTDVRLPLTMPSSSTARSFFVRMMSAASFETSGCRVDRDAAVACPHRTGIVHAVAHEGNDMAPHASAPRRHAPSGQA
jgi:hypothetical protein